MQKHITLKNIITELIKNVKKQDYLVYFRKLSILEISSNKVTFGVASGFMKDNLKAKFEKQILEATQSELVSISQIEFLVDREIDNPANTNVVDCTVLYKEATKASKSKKTTYVSPVETVLNKGKTINERYSLKNYIVGGDNQLAYSACEAVSRNPGNAYNPLYIYGDVGLGKTHLLQ
jgi:chromosomal replication initiator protein